MAKGGHAAVILLTLDRQWAADAVQYDEHRESLVREKIGIAGKRREISRLPSPLGTMARRTVLLPDGLAVELGRWCRGRGLGRRRVRTQLSRQGFHYLGLVLIADFAPVILPEIGRAS